MKRTQLKNLAHKNPSIENQNNYKKQRNFVSNLNKRVKKQYFANLASEVENKNFWATCKPLFSKKSSWMSEKLILIENNKVLNDDLEIATVFNEYFNNITSNLEIPEWENDYTYTVLSIRKFHPSITFSALACLRAEFEQFLLIFVGFTC